MTMLIASLMFVLLLAIAIAHLLWAFGRSWPIRDRELLPRVVVGIPGVERLPRLPAFVVALLAFAAALASVSLADESGDPWLTAAGVVLALLFLGRGITGYTERWASRHSLEPYRTLDRRTYSPLALLLGVGFAVLVLMRLL